MKWNSPGNEVIDKKYNFEDGVILFGAGTIGRRYLNLATDKSFVSAFVDNNKSGTIQGIPIWNIQNMIQNRKKELIIISLGEVFINEIVEQLEDYGLVKEEDYVIHSKEVMEAFYKRSVHDDNSVFIPVAQISLTERCTLKCKKCAHGCNYVGKDAKDMSLDEAYKSADYFFKYTDYCEEFVLIGGETFLYRNINDVIKYVGYKYRNKINIFSITTNGTIVPEKSTLECCKEYNMLIRISNYEKTLPRLREKHNKLIKKLESYGVPYVLGQEEIEWMDYGFENADYGCDEHALIKHFDECKTPCREIQGSKYFYCVMAHTAGKNMNHKGYNPDDCLDLEQLDCNPNGKRIFLEYNLGYSEKGYLDMCRYCNGANAKNFPIPAAEQMERL